MFTFEEEGAALNKIVERMLTEGVSEEVLRSVKTNLSNGENFLEVLHELSVNFLLGIFTCFHDKLSR
jgi:hypothetical protein